MRTMLDLYILPIEIKNLVEAYNVAETESEQDVILQQLWVLYDNLKDRCMYGKRLVKIFEAELGAYDNEIERLSREADSRKKAISNLKETMRIALLASELPEPKVGEGIDAIRVQRNAVPSVTLPDYYDSDTIKERIPKQFRRTVPVRYELDWESVKDSIKEKAGIEKGEKIPMIEAKVDQWHRDSGIPSEVEIKIGNHLRL